MGSYKEDLERDLTSQKYEKKVKICMGCLGSALMSLVGGLVLVWWQLYYHPTNSQLWMVPFGLILFVTPVIICFSVFFSYLCNSREANHHVSSPNRPFVSQDYPVHDPER